MTQLSLDFGPPEPPEGPAPPEPPEPPDPPVLPDGGPGADAPWAPPDEPERVRIRTELDANLLVEAGAGSGKTTSMVGRMVAQVRAGREVDRLAAVTFTRKAAAELRERFQEALEAAYRTAEATGDEVARVRFGTALDAIDRCFLGTIHSFCARLLRERPLEAGVPPDFEEVSGVDEDRLRAESWTRFLERLAGREGSRLLRAMVDVGLRPAQLQGAFREVADNPDVRFPAPSAPAVDPGELEAVRRRLEALLDRSERLMPAEEPFRGWDKLQTKVRRLRFHRWVLRWADHLAFLQALEEAVHGKNDVIQIRWGDDRETKQAAKALRDDWDEFCAEGGRAVRLLETWWAQRYRVGIRFARAAAGAYSQDRLRLGKLTFQDLLVRTATLLRNDPGARRELGERYRWLLVDEFQDTDPVQAEMLLLLASDPAEGTAWQRVTPRPGALFVVGDPKQSIYRFRRADIAVYNQVKHRFQAFGDVLHLVTNFRSVQPIETFVNRVFRDRFPAVESEHQAAFAELRVRPDRVQPGQGIYWYTFDAPGQGRFSGARIADPECGMLASWIAGRIRSGERRAADFMVLATRKSELATYARALEQHGVAVQVTGAGVGAEAELAELILLLRALADPDDPVLTLAVLEGLFFGLSHDDLLDHARAGGRLALGDDTGSGPVAHALATLRSFWRLTRRLPADVAVPVIVDRLGILPWAAAGELGATRAGAVLYALDAIRSAARDGAASLADAIDILDTALTQEVDAPLIPGETDAVRLMNLHKAKGLEAPVVVLAYPAKLEAQAVRRHIARDEAGDALGWLRILDPTRPGARTVALPADWPAHEAAELPFEQAEEMRRLYVAATRAAHELVIARCDQTADGSCWDTFHDALDSPDIAHRVELTAAAPPPRRRLEVDADTLQRRIDDTARARESLAQPAYRARPVTARVHGEGPGSVPPGDGDGDGDGGGDGGEAGGTDGPGGPNTEVLYLEGPELRPPGEDPREARGTDWGSAVHRAMEAAARGADANRLRAIARAALVEFDRPVDPATGAPEELDELVSLVARVRASPVWDRVRTARRVLVETPFSFAVSGDEARRLGIVDPAPAELVEGVIDLALQDNDGRWTLIDFKTGSVPDARARAVYAAQLRLYAEGMRRGGGGGPTAVP